MQRARRIHLVQGAILLLALVRGLLYASAMPPWSIIDEQQHMHYVQSLAEAGRIPMVGQTLISDEIARASAARNAVLHWSAHATLDPRDWGLEGQSYEGYQPPLFYLVMAPVYFLLPGDMLAKLYGLRWAVVLLSLITVWLCMVIARRIFPAQPLLPYLAALVLIAIPERTLAMSRVNNDALTEVLAAVFILQVTTVMLDKITARRSIGLGVVFGLGMFTKLSFIVLAPLLLIVLWQQRKSAGVWRCAAWCIAVAVALTAPWLVRNLWLYGDFSARAGFEAIGGGAIQAAPFTVAELLRASAELFRGVWIIWWKGARAASNPLVDGLVIVIAGFCLLSLITWARMLRASERSRTALVFAYLVAIAAFSAAVIGSHFSEWEPLPQGRLMLPAIIPIVILLCYGLLRSQWGARGVIALIVILLALDALSLFGNLLPYYYYWSAFVVNGVPQPWHPQGLTEIWAVFYPRLLSDKPGMVLPLLHVLPVLYVGALTCVAYTMRSALRITPPLIPPQAGGEQISTLRGGDLPAPTSHGGDLPAPTSHGGDLPAPSPRDGDLPAPTSHGGDLPAPAPRDGDLPAPSPHAGRDGEGSAP